MPMSKSKVARDVRRVPTVKTLIAYKRTHIEREQARLRKLETMEGELLAIVR